MTEKVAAHEPLRPISVCKTCKRHLKDSLFGLDEFDKSNMAGSKYGAKKENVPLDRYVATKREKFNQWATSRGFKPCTVGCKRLIILAGEGEP